MNEQDELLIARYLDGRADEAEVAALNARIAADPEFRAALIRAGRMDAALREILQVRAQKPTLDGKVGGTIPAAGRFGRRRWLVAAAAAVLLGAAGLWVWQVRQAAVVAIARLEAVADPLVGLDRNGQRQTLTAAIEVLAGDVIDTTALPAADAAVATVRFPDGTTVALVGGTRAQFDDGAAGKRVEVFTGLTRSAVAHQPAGRPLRFVSRFGSATVVGTQLSFQVNASAARLEVTEGQVELQRAADGASAMISAGQYAEAGASADAALVALALPPPTPATPAADRFVEDFEQDPIGQPPACAAGPEKQGWRVVAEGGNRFAETQAVDLAELEVGRKYLSNYHVSCRFRVADADTSFGIYTPFYGVDDSVWGLEVKGTAVYLLAGKTNPTTVGTVGRTPVAQVPALAAGVWHTLHLEVDAHTMRFELDGRPVVVDQPNFMQPGLWRFFAKGGRMQFDDLKVEMIPH